MKRAGEHPIHFVVYESRPLHCPLFIEALDCFALYIFTSWLRGEAERTIQ